MQQAKTWNNFIILFECSGCRQCCVLFYHDIFVVNQDGFCTLGNLCSQERVY